MQARITLAQKKATLKIRILSNESSRLKLVCEEKNSAYMSNNMLSLI